MARSRRTQILIDQVLEVVSQSGDIDAAIAAAQVPKSTFTTWIKKDEQFAKDLQKAQQEFRSTQSQYQIHLAKKRVRDYLVHGHVVTKKELTVKVTEDETGRILKVEKSTTTTEENRGTPIAILDRVLGEPTNIERVLNTLVEEDIIPGDRLEKLQVVLTELKHKSLEILFNEVQPNARAITPAKD